MYIIDQEITTATSTSSIGDVSNNELREAIKITTSDSYYIAQVNATLGASAGSPSGTLRARIETDSSGVPSGTLVDANATSAITPAASSENIWIYTPFLLSAGTYWIVLDCDNQSTNIRWTVVSQDTSPPAWKAAQSVNGTWSALNDRSYLFKLYGIHIKFQKIMIF